MKNQRKVSTVWPLLKITTWWDLHPGQRFHSVKMTVTTRITSLALLLVLAGSAFAGIPMPFGDSECSMGQTGMDCCKSAMMGGENPEATAARLCCVVNCSHEGSTPPSAVRVLPQSQPACSDYQPGIPAPFWSAPLTLHIDRSHGPPTDSHPAYIRHLALLI